jgi:hypothetical protein
MYIDLQWFGWGGDGGDGPGEGGESAAGSPGNSSSSGDAPGGASSWGGGENSANNGANPNAGSTPGTNNSGGGGGSQHGGGGQSPFNGQPATTPTTPATTAPTAQDLAEAAQAGAVNSAGQAAQAQGMSAAEAAQMGAQSGSSTYQSTLPMATLTMRGQDIQQQEAAAQLAMAQNQANAQQQGNFWTTIASFFHLAEGTNDAPGGTSILGEHGAEIVKHFGGDDEVVGQNGPEVQNLEKHSQVIPIQDGYDMLKYAMKPVAQHVKSRMGNAQPQAKPETLQTMRPKFDEAVQYMRMH